MNENVMTHRPSDLERDRLDGRPISPEARAPRARPETPREERIAARRKAFDLILCDALSGSRLYVESYRAGRGAE